MKRYSLNTKTCRFLSQNVVICRKMSLRNVLK
nr:MAG TPA: hypothetical protein [Caudoviricetes sp.]